MHNGVFAMSMAIDGLVETSSSLSRVIVKDGKFITQSLQRSSVDTAKMEVAYTIGSVFKLIGSEVEHTGSYPGWSPNPKSEILDLMIDKYTPLIYTSFLFTSCDIHYRIKREIADSILRNKLK